MSLSRRARIKVTSFSVELVSLLRPKPLNGATLWWDGGTAASKQLLPSLN